MKSHDAARSDRNFLSRLGISARPLRLVAQLKITES